MKFNCAQNVGMSRGHKALYRVTWNVSRSSDFTDGQCDCATFVRAQIKVAIMKVLPLLENIWSLKSIWSRKLEAFTPSSIMIIIVAKNHICVEDLFHKRRCNNIP